MTALKIRDTEKVIKLIDPDGSSSDSMAIIDMISMEIVGKIEPPEMIPVYKEGYSG